MNGDVVGFFNELGISLPTKKSGGNVRVRCFAQPEAHKHGDKTAAASVRLEDGVWNCFACSANGNAYEAAIAVGKTPAEAMALLERHGLSKPKPARAGRRSKTATMVPKKPATPSETKLEECRRALAADAKVRARLAKLRGWTDTGMNALEVGYDGERVVFGTRDLSGALAGLLRYRPDPDTP